MFNKGKQWLYLFTMALAIILVPTMPVSAGGPIPNTKTKFVMIDLGTKLDLQDINNERQICGSRYIPADTPNTPDRRRALILRMDDNGNIKTVFEEKERRSNIRRLNDQGQGIGTIIDSTGKRMLDARFENGVFTPIMLLLSSFGEGSISLFDMNEAGQAVGKFYPDSALEAPSQKSRMFVLNQDNSLRLAPENLDAYPDKIGPNGIVLLTNYEEDEDSDSYFPSASALMPDNSIVNFGEGMVSTFSSDGEHVLGIVPIGSKPRGFAGFRLFQPVAWPLFLGSKIQKLPLGTNAIPELMNSSSVIAGSTINTTNYSSRPFLYASEEQRFIDLKRAITLPKGWSLTAFIDFIDAGIILAKASAPILNSRKTEEHHILLVPDVLLARG